MNKKTDIKKVTKTSKPATKKTATAKKAPVKKVAAKKTPVKKTVEKSSQDNGGCKLGGKCPAKRFLSKFKLCKNCGPCNCTPKKKLTVLLVVALLLAFTAIKVVENKIANEAVDKIKESVMEKGLGFEAEKTSYNLFTKSFLFEDASISLIQAPGINITISEAMLNVEFFEMFNEGNEIELPKKAKKTANYIKGISINEEILMSMRLPADTAMDIYFMDKVNMESITSKIRIAIKNIANLAFSVETVDLKKYVDGLNTFAINSEKNMGNDVALEEDYNKLFESIVFKFIQLSFEDKGFNAYIKEINPEVEKERELALVELKYNKNIEENKKVLIADFIKSPMKLNIKWNNTSNINLREFFDLVKSEDDILNVLDSGFYVNLNDKIVFDKKVEVKTEEVIKVETKNEESAIETEAK